MGCTARWKQHLRSSELSRGRSCRPSWAFSEMLSDPSRCMWTRRGLLLMDHEKRRQRVYQVKSGRCRFVDQNLGIIAVSGRKSESGTCEGASYQKEDENMSQFEKFVAEGKSRSDVGRRIHGRSKGRNYAAGKRSGVCSFADVLGTAGKLVVGQWCSWITMKRWGLCTGCTARWMQISRSSAPELMAFLCLL